MPSLSKSSFLAGLSCPRYLWLSVHAPSRLKPVSPSLQSVFDQGQAVGLLAQECFPNGVAIPLGKDSVSKTSKLVSAARLKPLFEASFSNGSGYCKVDVLNPVGNEWDLIEVKSSTSVKEEYLWDVAFQKWVLEGAGVKVRDVAVWVVNPFYKLKTNKVNPKSFFSRKTISDVELAPFLELIPDKVERFTRLLASPVEPRVVLGLDCVKPKECLACSVGFKPGGVHELYYGGSKVWPLVNAGVSSLGELPVGFALNFKQKVQVNAVKSGKVFVDVVALKTFLESVTFPVYHLDFETVGSAIPRFIGTKPFQQVPFQFSVHVQHAPRDSFSADYTVSAIKHFEFLAKGKADPRKAVLTALKAALAGFERGTVLAYNASFEKNVLSSLAKSFPREEKWVEAVNSRMVDLIEPFKAFWVHHPDQQGSNSLKFVHPALTGSTGLNGAPPHHAYHSLEIQEGASAQREYERVTYSKVSAKERARVYNALLAYCKQDTQSMIDVLEFLQKAVSV